MLLGLGLATAIAAAACSSGSTTAESAGTTATSDGAGSEDLGDPSQGVTEDTVKIGFWVLELNAACAGLGIDESPGCEESDRREMQALIDWVNDNGGLAGRKLEAVFVEGEVQQSRYSAEAQAACEAFADDHEVFAVVVQPQFTRPDLVRCLSQREIPVIDGGFWPFDEQDYEELAGYLYQPARATPERWVAAYIDGLEEQGFFDDDPNVALVRFEGGAFDRVTESVLKPRLDDLGVELVEEAVISPPESVGGGYEAMTAALNNAVLRFRDADVDHVLFFGTLGELELFFLPGADTQDFRPVYGFSSMAYPGTVEKFAPLGAASIDGSMGVGWLPGYDVHESRDPGRSSGAALCEEIMLDAGQAGAAGRNGKCDLIFFLKAALDAAPTLNPAGVRQAVEQFDDAFEPASTFEVRFGPGRYDGAASVRNFAFESECNCFQYTGDLHEMP